MRILNVNATIDPVMGGGTAERTFQLSRCFARLGAECALLTLDLGITAERLQKLTGVAVTALRCVAPRYYVFPFPEPRVAKLVGWADVVHVVGHWTLLNAAIFRAARRLGKPHVVCPAGALSIYGRSHFLKASYNWMVGKSIIREARACVAISGNETAQFVDYGVSSDQVTLIPNGIDPQEFGTAPSPDIFRAKFGLSGVPFILFMGRLNSIKGPDLLLEAFVRTGSALSHYHLVFAGPDGGMLQQLQEMAAHRNASTRVHFIGHVDATDKIGAYHASDLLVIPSRQEAMSIVVLEAGACNRPVLITDCCGFNEVERIGGGRVVPASAEGLESGLLEMLRDADALRSMGERLGALVRHNFLWEFAARKYLALFSRVVH